MLLGLHLVDVVVEELAQVLPAGGGIAVIVPVAALLPSPAVRVLVADLAQGTQDCVDPFPSGD
ncbi:hypothetical protein [Streptomyces sp. NPDC053367]|uniref:hypothetical protein n=1 Tax=Streptomyces sp. NPDC053367 TaxID=3365700 RepID=UPI0037D96951